MTLIDVFRVNVHPLKEVFGQRVPTIVIGDKDKVAKTDLHTPQKTKVLSEDSIKELYKGKICNVHTITVNI